MARTVTANTTLANGEDYLWADATAEPITVTLPALPGVAGAVFIIFKADASANGVTVTPSGADTILGEPNMILTAFGQSMTLISGPAQWWLL